MPEHGHQEIAIWKMASLQQEHQSKDRQKTKSGNFQNKRGSNKARKTSAIFQEKTLNFGKA
jgi:hypothetical protein